MMAKGGLIGAAALSVAAAAPVVTVAALGAAIVIKK
jgi:hypothetical protein